MTRGSTGRGRNRRKAYLPARVGDLATSLADWRASSVSVDGQEQGFCPPLTSSPGYRGGARQGQAETRVVLGPPGGERKHTVDANDLTHVCGDGTAKDVETASWKVKQEKSPWKKGGRVANLVVLELGMECVAWLEIVTVARLGSFFFSLSHDRPVDAGSCSCYCVPC